MSSNFWASSHCKYWLVTRNHLESSRLIDLKYATPRQLLCLNIWFASLIQKLGKRLQLRQIPIATATVFFRRFYLKNSICETNPYLVLAACCFVAAKVEETPVHIKNVVSEAKLVFTEHNIKTFPAEPHKVGEMEFYLLEDLDFHLAVFHPYRALVSICGREPSDSGRWDKTRVEEDQELGGEDEVERLRRLMGRGSGEGLMEIEEGVLQIAWFTINDTYRTDVSLLYPPYIIALSCLYIAFTLTTMTSNARTRSASSSQTTTLASSIETNALLNLPAPPKSPAEFLASFEVSLPVLLACIQDIIIIYPVWEAFEPTPLRSNNGTAIQVPPPLPPGEKKFGPEDAEALVRKMIEERMIDVSHPDNAGDKRKRTKT